MVLKLIGIEIQKKNNKQWKIGIDPMIHDSLIEN